ncbi:MAG: DNA adenine methylase [Candidatus Gastranaerophilales bacterium]|nr:DNA adenine methylase [Candidatus Gastranaerophilales bacterium]
MRKKIDTRYLINWIGGKRLLRYRISELIPDDIKTYIEPFGGGGWVLFYKDNWAELEIYNDLNDKLVNLFKCVKFHPDELIKEFRWMIASRKIFKETLESTVYTDIQKAAKFLYLISRSFGGAGRHFGTGKRPGGAAKSQQNIMARILSIHERLDKVIIENLGFEELIAKYDYEDAFFYCDPPYTSGVGYEVISTKDFDHEGLRDCLKNIKGRFLLSYDDSPKIRELYKNFEMIEVTRQKGINNKCPNGREYKELLIANYKIT